VSNANGGTAASGGPVDRLTAAAVTIPDWAIPDWAIPDWAIPDWAIPD